MRKSALATIVVLVCFFLVNAGCYYEKRLAKKQEELLKELQEHAGAYNRMIVWGDYDGASAAVVPEKRIQFLETSQEVMSRVKIEDYTIPLCQVGTVPFPRDELIPETKPLLPKNEPAYKPLEPDAGEGVEPVGPDRPDVPEKPVEAEAKKKAKPKMPKVFYGVALVRYINMTVAPSVTVTTRLLKQHWVWVDGVWYCDADLNELLE